MPHLQLEHPRLAACPRDGKYLWMVRGETEEVDTTQSSTHLGLAINARGSIQAMALYTHPRVPKPKV